MILFSDTDILLKLGALDLFEEALDVLGVSRQEIRVLPEAKHYLRKRRTKLIEQYGDEGVQRALAFAESVAAFEHAPNAGEQELLLGAGLDVGEAGLFAATASVAAYTVLTGDKRAMRDLSNSLSCKKIHARHHGKVLCLEALLLRILDRYEFQGILSKVVPGYECDTAVRVAFGSAMKAQRATVVRSLKKRVTELNKETGGALLSMDR